MNMSLAPLKLPLLSLALVLMLPGCAEYHKRVLEDTPEEGPKFTRALATEYGRLGEIEQGDMYDYWAANYYFRKAICAKKGLCVGPTCLEKWDLPEEKIPELALARLRLLSAFAQGARKRAPLLAAHAQAHFDCWVEQQAEEWQHNDIAACRYAFYRSMAEIEFLLKGGASRVMPNEHVFFGMNSAKVSIKDLKNLKKLAHTHKSRHILLIGRHDYTGESYHNKKLAHARALAVKKALIHAGVSPHLITVKEAGPLPGPKVNVHDRRVDIIFLSN